MKSLENPLEDGALKEMAPKYSFLLLMAFEGAVKIQEWAALKSIILVSVTGTIFNIVQEAGAAQCSLRVFECMADLILCGEEVIPDEISLRVMQVQVLKNEPKV